MAARIALGLLHTTEGRAMSENVRFIRFWLSRVLIHAGLRVLPQGRMKSELYNLIYQWAIQVQAALAAKRTGDE